jgi:hypothetical protein
MRLRASMATALSVVALSSCGSAPPTPSTGTPSATASPAPRPSAATGPCASVTTTTAIESVPAACAALWAPYGVTKVPPANLTDPTPSPPQVVNATNGTASEAQAYRWADDINRAAMWNRWAEKYNQVNLLPLLLSPSLVPSSERLAMSRGAAIDQPDCSSFGNRYKVLTLGVDGAAFFAGIGQTATSPQVVAVTYPGPCQITATYPDGHREVLFSFGSAGITVIAGTSRDDPVLGEFWFTQASADCNGPGRPTAWCAP